MLQQLAADTGSRAWAIASMLFFLGVWIAMAVRVARARPEELAEHARLPLLDDDGGAPPISAGAGRRA